MRSITTLEWSGDFVLVAYGPRGARYTVTSPGDHFVVTRYDPDVPAGRKIGVSTTKERAMELAQRDVERLTEKIAEEHRLYH